MAKSKMYTLEKVGGVPSDYSQFWRLFLCSYFIVRPVLTLILHAQLVLPTVFYPEYLVEFHAWYCRVSKDPLLTNTYPWFQSLMLAQLFIQAPFELFSLWSIYKGGKKYVRWLPVYVAHVLTCILPAVFEIVYGNHYEGNEYKSMVAALLPKLYDALCVAFLRVYYIRYDILGSERVAD